MTEGTIEHRVKTEKSNRVRNIERLNENATQRNSERESVAKIMVQNRQENQRETFAKPFSLCLMACNRSVFRFVDL